MNSQFTYAIFLAIAFLPSQALAQSLNPGQVKAIDTKQANLSQSLQLTGHDDLNLASNQIIHVNSQNGKNNGNGSRSEPVKTISQALTMAEANTVIILSPGNYSTATGETFPLVVPDQVTIQGNGDQQGKQVIIQGNGDFTSQTFGRQNVTLVMGDRTRLTGVTVKNQSTGFAIWLENIKATLTNNTLTSQGVGLAIQGNSQVIIQDNNFLQAKNGMVIGGTVRGEVRDNSFERTGQGITITDQAKPLIVGNRLVNNQDGIFVTGQSQPVLRGNYLEKNQRDGIVITEQALPDIGNTQEPGRNTIRGNGRYDLHNTIASTVIPAYGNLLESDRLRGNIDVIGASQPTRAIGNTTATLGSQVNTYRRSTNNISVGASTSQAEISPNLISQRGDRPYLVVPQTVNPSPANNSRPLSPNRRNILDRLTPRNNRQPVRRPATAVDNGDWSMPNTDNSGYDTNNNGNSNWNNNNNWSNASNNSNTVSLGLLPVPNSNIPIGSGGYVPPGLGISGFAANPAPLNPITVDYRSSRNRAIALGLRYRVVVDITNSQQTQTLLSIVPYAFRINIGGRSLMQAGAYQDRGEANQLLQVLVSNGLPARIESIR